MNTKNQASAPAQTLIELQEVTQVFPDGNGAIEVLKHIDLNVPAGQMIAIMGPSGSGKTTLLKIIGGLLRPTSGRVIYENTDLATLSDAQLARHRRRHLGYVFQDYNLVENLTAEENVALPLELDGISTAKARQAAVKSLTEMGIEDLAGRWAADLSGGQAQRVAVARALVQPGRLLLADEPTGALDSVASDEIMGLLRGRVDAGATCLMVTHEARLAAWADQILYLRDGQFISAAEGGVVAALPPNLAAEVKQETPASGVEIQVQAAGQKDEYHPAAATPPSGICVTEDGDCSPLSDAAAKKATGSPRSTDAPKKNRGHSGVRPKSPNRVKTGKNRRSGGRK